MRRLEQNIKRIIFNVDPGGVSPSIMESAVILASRLQAELCGLYIQDTDLLELANLPFTREITLHTALSRELSSFSMERNLAAMAVRMHQTLEDLAKLSNVGFSFRTVRGPRLESILKESEDFQLIMMTPQKRLTDSIRQAISMDRKHPAVLYYDGSVQARRGVRIIKSLGTDTAIKHLLILTGNESAEAEIFEQFPATQYQVKCLRVADYNVMNILTLLRTQSPGLVILPLGNILVRQEKDVRKMLDILSCLLLLVR